MQNSLIGALRDSVLPLRMICVVIILAFGGLVTSPAVAAIRDYKAPAAEAASSQASRMASALRKITYMLDKAPGGMAAQGLTAQQMPDFTSLQRKVADLNSAVLDHFHAVGEMIQAKHLPKVIQERQKATVDKYKKAMGKILAKLNAVANSRSNAERSANIQAAYKLLKGMKFKRSHQPYDPNNLNAAFKAHPNHKPKTQRKQFLQANLFSKPRPMFAALDSFDFSRLAGASNPVYLEETPEVQLTQAIRDKAAELDHDPVKIYDWVRNHVEWIPTWGAFQNSDMTLSTRRGNSMDITSLTIALLRASGIPSRYVYGTIDVPVDKFMNWVGDFADISAAQNYASVGGIATATVTSGGQVTKMRMEHVWVEAAIDYYPSRGARNVSADSWVAMDPSFKQYDYKPGLDIAKITGLDGGALVDAFQASGTVNEDEGWVQGLDPAIIENAQQQANEKLNAYITNNMNDPTAGDVVGGRRAIIKKYPDLPSSLPYHVVIAGHRYAELPDGLRYLMTFAFGKDVLGQPTDPIQFPWAAVNNERITLSFRPATDADKRTLRALLPDGGVTDPSQLPSSIPAYLIQVVPELKLNGKVIKTGPAMNLGEELNFVFQVRTPLETRPSYTYKVIAGSYLAIATIGQNVSFSRLLSVKDHLNDVKTILQSGDPVRIGALSREDVLGNIYEAGLLGYFAEYNAVGHLMALQRRAGHGLSIGYGSFGYEPNVVYLVGIPTAITSGGVVVNMRIGSFITTHKNDRNENIRFNEQLGLLSSMLESSVPEQMLTTPDHPGEAISAAKAMEKAELGGQRIYHITPANMSDTLPSIHHGSLVMQEIRAALAVGDEVITHTADVSVPGWTGAGYIILDPQTGIGAYKIGGGTNGGYLATGISVLLLAITFIPAVAALFPTLLFFVLMTAIVAVLTFTTVLSSLSGCGGKVGVGVAVLAAFISLIPGEEGEISRKVASAVRLFLSDFILSNGFTSAENAVCKLG
ncbi:MAG TPA: transglutaminase-like domain-containing protein [Gammaproteobacteria bacterium]|nr:transglutaminase-like domain-containing protein [Gammaproteobacteria bacterium]